MIKEVIKAKTNEHGYLVKVKGFSKYFSVKKHGGVYQTYLLACALEKTLIEMGHTNLTLNQANNQSGVSGFFLRVHPNTIELVYNYKDAKGSLQAKTLSLRKYGLQKALTLAVEHRLASNLPTPTVSELQESLAASTPSILKYSTS